MPTKWGKITFLYVSIYFVLLTLKIINCGINYYLIFKLTQRRFRTNKLFERKFSIYRITLVRSQSVFDVIFFCDSASNVLKRFTKTILLSTKKCVQHRIGVIFSKKQNILFQRNTINRVKSIIAFYRVLSIRNLLKISHFSITLLIFK